MPKLNRTALVPLDRVTRSILVLRGQKVLLDSDLAELYGVPTKVLNQAVKRNIERFPEDFMFRLARAEVDALNRSQSVTGSQKHRHPRFRLHVHPTPLLGRDIAGMGTPRCSPTRSYECSTFLDRSKAISARKHQERPSCAEQANGMIRSLMSTEAPLTLNKQGELHEHTCFDKCIEWPVA